MQYWHAMRRLNVLVFGLLAFADAMAVSGNAPYCPKLYHQGVLELPFNPAFLHLDRFSDGEALTISSFFNSFRDKDSGEIRFFAADQVAQIPSIERLKFQRFDPSADLVPLTDIDFTGAKPRRTVWPNEASKVPDGMLPFEGVIVPQGFHAHPQPGRLSIINRSDPLKTEYIVHQSTQAEGGFTFPGDPANTPAYYHKVVYIDMDNDGLKDIVTVRSNFKVLPSLYPPFGELVWFKNPGNNIQPMIPWQQTVLFGGPAAEFLGPDIHLTSGDFESDGIPEIVATHFFTGDRQSGQPPQDGKVVIYGAPKGKTWLDVDSRFFALPRIKTISSNQGFPFDIEIVDLNRDGRQDVLITNHQPDNCTPQTSSLVPGRVYALEAPVSGDLFRDKWRVRILLDGIRPNPSLPDGDGKVSPPGRLAPGKATAFYPAKLQRYWAKPSIVVGGDEASKVWVLTPKSEKRDNWDYKAAVIFDINEIYGPGTTQTELSDPNGVSISTIGGIGIRYDRPDIFGLVQFYIPVFEAKAIHVVGYRHLTGSPVRCTEDRRIACPVLTDKANQRQ